ncbi:MAG: two-component system response regulator FixJ [Pseudohongiellaceae bacterium]|jgi:two-component system response regulator FixJ
MSGLNEPTVYIVDDDEAFRDALEMLVRTVGLQFRSFESAVAFLDQYDNDVLGCLLLDIRMPLMSGLELQDELLARDSNLPIIFLSSHGDIPMAIKAVKKGAWDFLSKPFRDQELLDCIQSAMLKNHAAEESLALRLDIDSNLTSLTPREKQILDLIVEGIANKVIAIKLDISQRTVEVHRANVMKKMEARSLAHLVTMISALAKPAD